MYTPTHIQVTGEPKSWNSSVKFEGSWNCVINKNNIFALRILEKLKKKFLFAQSTYKEMKDVLCLINFLVSPTLQNKKKDPAEKCIPTIYRFLINKILLFFVIIDL